ncbi:MAG: cysteine protease StiP family protein [Candidatus Saccharibacteria bacterium]|nr:cysteine protease StiP family protein [Moraxellaceae bacterium]
MAITNKQIDVDAILANGFSGSYRPNEVLFLLQKTHLDATPTAEKERLIQSGAKHYSQMISIEHSPSERHLQLFATALAQNATRMATEVQMLAQRLAQEFTAPIVLVSFVRAGVPLGVLLYHALADLSVEAVHYGISIVRDRGIDYAALETIVAKHGAQSLVFVDGWTGKGAISKQLEQSLGQDPRFAHPTRDCLPLVTLADVGGCAWLAASGDDWLIPSGILGSTISGLISRSICIGDALTAETVNNDNLDQWHGCIEYHHLAEFDQSTQFIDQINQIRRQLTAVDAAKWTRQQRQKQQQQASHVIQQIADDYQISNLNRIKPGIAEATRAILRRVPEVILLRDEKDPDTALLRHLAEQTNTPIKIVGEALAPYRAVTLIQKLGAA